MRTTLFIVLITTSLFGVSPKAAAQDAISEIEQAIVDHIDSRSDRALQLLELVVNINSGSLNLEGVREVGRVFEREFDSIGFETRWVDGSPFNRAGHLVASRKGDGPHFVMIGHLDTVFEPDSPFQKYERLSESRARGPGVSDMKGGNVIILEALRALNAVGVLDRMTVTVVLIGDEESSGRPLDLSRKVLFEAAEAADIALAFENGDDQLETAVIARRGFSGWKLEVTAKPGHSSQVFKEDMGYGAIYEAARILSSFYQELAGEENLTFNPGVIVGGTTIHYDASQSSGTAFGKSNVIAERTTVEGDLRTLTIEQRESAKDRMRAIVSKSLNGATAKITFSDGYPPLAPTDGNRHLLSLLDQTSRDLGFGGVSAVDPSKAGAADVSFTAGLIDMALDGLGLLGADNHTVNETANLNLLPIQAKRAAVLMHRLASTEGTD